MHRAWGITEIVAHIASHLKQYKSAICSIKPVVPTLERSSLSSLAALSRTCHAISDVELEELWAEPGGLIPVLGCLPSHLWQGTPSPNVLPTPAAVSAANPSQRLLRTYLTASVVFRAVSNPFASGLGQNSHVHSQSEIPLPFVLLCVRHYGGV